MRFLLLAAAVVLAPSLAQASCTNGRMSSVYNNSVTMPDGPSKMAVNSKLGLANTAYALGTMRECDFHLAEAVRIQGIAARLEAKPEPDYSSLAKFEMLPGFELNKSVSEPQKRSIDKRPRVDAMCGDSECNVPVTETRYSQPFGGGGGHSTDRPMK